MAAMVLTIEETKSGGPLEFPITRQISAWCRRRRSNTQQYRALEVGAAEPRVGEIRCGEVGVAEIAPLKVGGPEVETAVPGAEVRGLEIAQAEIGPRVGDDFGKGLSAFAVYALQ